MSPKKENIDLSKSTSRNLHTKATCAAKAQKTKMNVIRAKIKWALFSQILDVLSVVHMHSQLKYSWLDEVAPFYNKILHKRLDLNLFII